MRELRRLKPAHTVALRLIILGMPVKEAAEMIGVSPTYMSTINNSDLGREYTARLNAAADDYVARMMALGLTPRLLLKAVGRTKRPHGAEWGFDDFF